MHSSNGGKLPYINGERTSKDSWYYSGFYQSSYAWTSANFFAQHWGKTNGQGNLRAYKVKEYINLQAVIDDYDNVYSELFNGNIIQFVDRTTNNAHHSIIIHNESLYNNIYQRWDILYAQHTDNKKDVLLFTRLNELVAVNNTDKLYVYKIKN